MARILVIDDSPYVVSLTSKMLAREGYDVMSRPDGESGLLAVMEHKPDLVLLDVMMPGINGMDVCRIIKSNPATRFTPVVLLTARDFVDDKIAGLETGADDYITKPFDVKELLARIRAILLRAAERNEVEEQERIEALNSLLDSLSHEVRNPIVSIAGFSRKIQAAVASDSDLARYAGRILHESQRLERMLEAVLKLQTLRVVPSEHLVLQEVLQEVYTASGHRVAHAGISANLDLPADPVCVWGDRRAVRLVFAHVFENAIDAMPDGGELTCSLQIDSAAVVTVQDTGAGIEEQAIGKVMRPFYSTKTAGGGLGLTMVRSIMQQHGGVVEVRSRSGRGTTIVLRFPLGDQPTTAA